VFVSSISNLFLRITFLEIFFFKEHFLEYKDENFIPKYLEKICLVNFIIFLETIKIGIIICNYILIYSHFLGNFIPTLLGKKFYSRNMLNPRIKFNKLLTNIYTYIFIILFSGINKYNLK